MKYVWPLKIQVATTATFIKSVVCKELASDTKIVFNSVIKDTSEMFLFYFSLFFNMCCK